MRKKNKFKKPEITNIYRVVRFDIEKETAGTYLENALEKVLRDMDDDRFHIVLDFLLASKSLKFATTRRLAHTLSNFYAGLEARTRSLSMRDSRSNATRSAMRCSLMTIGKAFLHLSSMRKILIRKNFLKMW